MKDELVGFEVAKLAKEKGLTSYDFDYCPDLCYNKKGYCYKSEGWIEDDYFCAITQALLQKWLRDKHKINVNGFIFGWSDLTFANHCKVNFNEGDFWEWFVPTKGKDNLSYEEALEIGLQEALKLIKV